MAELTAKLLASALIAAALVLDPTAKIGKPAAAPAEDDEAPPKKPAAKKPAAAADDEGGGDLDYTNDVRPLIVKLSKDHGKEVAAQVMSKFETEDGETCTKGQEVQEKDWPALVKAVKAKQKKLDAEKAAADDDDE